MRHARILNNKIFKFHERFRIIYNEKHSSFRWVFFGRRRSVSIQTRNLRIFVSDIFGDSKGIAPNVFTKLNPHAP